MLLAEGLYPDAIASAKAALTQVERALDVGSGQAEKEWLTAIVATCRERIEQEEVASRVGKHVVPQSLQVRGIDPDHLYPSALSVK